jgi:hypothetical protein
LRFQVNGTDLHWIAAALQMGPGTSHLLYLRKKKHKTDLQHLNSPFSRPFFGVGDTNSRGGHANENNDRHDSFLSLSLMLEMWQQLLRENADHD